MVSFVIGTPFSLSRQPCASKWTTLPLRATRVTAPAMRSASMYSWTKLSMRFRRSDDMPADSGLATITSSAARNDGAASSTVASKATIAPAAQPLRLLLVFLMSRLSPCTGPSTGRKSSVRVSTTRAIP